MNTEFIDELASSAPTPGGGGASAYVGALASALASMVGNLTVGKKKYAAVEDQMRERLVRLEDVRARLIVLIEEDERAFQPLADSYHMPHETPEEQAAKHAATQAALVGACEVPLAIMRCVQEVVELTDFMVRHGSALALSDAGVAATFARAAAEGASMTVFINAAAMDDKALAVSYRAQANDIITRVRIRCDSMFDYVRRVVS